MSVSGISGGGAAAIGGTTPPDASLVAEMKSHPGRELAEALVAGESFAPGAMGSHVASLIRLLTIEGAGDIKHGETMSPEVVKALRDFQKAEGLPITGTPDAETARALDARLIEIVESPAAKRAEAWRKFDVHTERGAKIGDIDHGRSAVENLKAGGEGIASAPAILAKGFMAIFGKDDVLGGSNNGILERLSNPLVGTVMAGASLFGGLKDVLIDAPAHAIANLFDGKK